MIELCPLRPQGGGHRVKNEMGLILKISWSRAGCKKAHQKILFLAEVMNFLNLAHNTITIRTQTSNRCISKRL